MIECGGVVTSSNLRICLNLVTCDCLTCWAATATSGVNDGAVTTTTARCRMPFGRNWTPFKRQRQIEFGQCDRDEDSTSWNGNSVFFGFRFFPLLLL